MKLQHFAGVCMAFASVFMLVNLVDAGSVTRCEGIVSAGVYPKLTASPSISKVTFSSVRPGQKLVMNKKVRHNGKDYGQVVSNGKILGWIQMSYFSSQACASSWTNSGNYNPSINTPYPNSESSQIGNQSIKVNPDGSIILRNGNMEIKSGPKGSSIITAP